MRIWRIPTNTARLLTGVTIIVGVVFSSLFGTPIAVSAPTPIAGDFHMMPGD